MINMLIDNNNTALNAGAYMSALLTALILPDACGKVEYPDERYASHRYKKWFDEYIGQYERGHDFATGGDNTPYLSGEVVYSLRCCLLHEGNPSIKRTEIRDRNNSIDRFVLVVEEKKPIEIYCDSASVNRGTAQRDSEYRLNIRRLCQMITICAKNYYEQHLNSFQFDYTLEYLT